MEWSGITEPVLLLNVSLSTWLRIECSYYEITSDLKSLTKLWGVEECIFKVYEEGVLWLNDPEQ